MRETLGLRGAFRGILPPVMLRGFSMGSNRAGYSAVERFFARKGSDQGSRELKGLELAVAGFVSGACQCITDHPQDRLKCRAQTTGELHFRETFASYWRMAMAISKKDGLSGWTRGLAP